MSPRYTDVVAALPATVPFVGPEQQERAMGRPFAARLGANESVFGPAPEAIAAMERAAAQVWKYGDAESFELRAELAALHGVGMENIVIGAGIDGLLGTLVRLLVAPGTPVVTSRGAYPTFNYHVAGSGGALHAVPYRDDAEDPDALLDAVRQTRAPLVYFCNPDNPMGSWHGAARVQAFIDALPEDTVLCLDEAYADFAPPDTLPAMDVSRPNVIRMRTFSKAHGMAGARIGYAIAHQDLIAAHARIRDHFGVNLVAQAGALASLRAPDWLAQVVAQVADARARMADIAAGNGLRALPSATNFVTIDCGRDGAHATAVRDGLVARGIFVRMPFAAPENRCIRVSAGRPEDLDAFAAALRETLRDLG
ncbi:pyridoxal phosphate-dependent aminotransferase [Halovulum dunhuangense]|uniref:Pyridoxal phosphate-dependent aminotransferase n=1 Tax=Halovulum dunhuangense TaxID=1505036 RepID=A0A849L591_9RHOB|nr:pyridoxal phosphate-dependent aminotransferase [Halovulum dunhuangense]NNU81350.1 pyridoxal phosphate-dependent aminotransferase [Halovulum dunhuangense]